MNWWEDAEAKALRARSPMALAQVLQQRFQAAGLDPDLSFAPAYDLARLAELCADLVKLTEGMLLLRDGDPRGLRRHLVAVRRWSEVALHWVADSAPAFNQLLDGLDLAPEKLAERDSGEPQSAGDAPPEQQAKEDGRYRYWHLLYERLDLKLASAGLGEPVHRGLARSLACLYEEALVTVRALGGLEREGTPHFRRVARLLLDINTVWHFDLGPNQLGAGRVWPAEPATLGIQTWLLLALAAAPPGNPQP